MNPIGVIGDYILDIYIHGECNRISPESPIPVFEQKKVTSYSGGSGNVARNLRMLGVIVEHHHSDEISEKTRYVVNNQIVFRSDLDVICQNSITDFHFSEKVEYVILSDYNKGFIKDPKTVINNLLKRNIKTVVDIKKPIENYANAYIVKMNEREHKVFCDGLDLEILRRDFNIQNIIITRGSKGSLVSTQNELVNIETDEHQVSDVTGAGDVYIAALVYFLNRGDDLQSSARYATKLASLSVTRFGTYVLCENDIRKVKPRIIFTNGCFDILHKGHIDYLQKSKELGDKLIVGINSDDSVRRLKGENRPINNQNNRKELLESLKFVDEVIIFNEDTPYELIKKVKPDIITKGGDYKYETDVVGYDLSKVVLIPFVDGYSTTKILEKL
jgi:D-beta-D-heptose 7-phosphate kinase / D-beta-D-heptose 1-phosphate adenosyltransferase